MPSGKAYKFRCQACLDGEITFLEYGVADMYISDPLDAVGALALILGCNNCGTRYCCVPQPDQDIVIVEET